MMLHGRTKALGILLALLAVGALVGCDDGGDANEGVVAMLAFDSMARSPEMIEAGQRIGLAMMLAQMKLQPAHAKELAALAREQGPALRDEIDDEFGGVRDMLTTLSARAEDILRAENPEEAMGQIVMDAGMMEMAQMFDGPQGPAAPVVGVLDRHQDLVAPIVTQMEPETLAQMTGLSNQVRSQLWGLRGPDPAGVDRTEAINGAANGIMQALGYENPEAEAWALDTLRPALVDLDALAEADWDVGMQQMIDIALMQVGPAAGSMEADAARVLVAIVANSQAPELLDVIAEGQ